MEQEKSTANSFGFDLGAGVSYPVIPKLAINLRADYFYSDPDFKISNTNRQNNAGRLVSEYHQPLTGINISLGIAYRFSRK
jgi:opacity protein-like surface antigen